MIIYVDGENFVHQVMHGLRKAGQPSQRSDIKAVDQYGLGLRMRSMASV
jgi:hypothetical protein